MNLSLYSAKKLLTMLDQRPYVCGIDVGPHNMGFAAGNAHNMDEVPYLEWSMIIATKDGRKYKYEEAYVEQMVMNWVKDRWAAYFSKAIIVNIEKQMSNMSSQMERACIQIENALKTIFLCMIPYGGPLYICEGPSKWKNRAGIEVGNNDIGPIPSHFASGVYHPPQYNPCHKIHKQRSIDKFAALGKQGDPEVKRIQQKYKYDLKTDVKEAYFIMRGTRESLYLSLEEALVSSDHSAALSTNGDRKSLRKRERQIPHLPLSELGEDAHDNLKKWMDAKIEDEPEPVKKRTKKEKKDPHTTPPDDEPDVVYIDFR